MESKKITSRQPASIWPQFSREMNVFLLTKLSTGKKEREYKTL